MCSWMDLWLKRSWGGEVKNVSVLVAIGVAQSGYRQILAVSEGAKEDKASWTAFLRELKERGLKGVKLFVSDKCLGLVENLAEFYPEASWQRCVVHFYRNVWTAVPTGKVKEVAAMLKAIHAQEDAQAAKEKARQVVEKLRAMKLARAAEIVAAGVDETLSYYAMPSEHWRSIKTNNPLERLMREIRRRTRVVGAFPDGKSASDAGRRPTQIRGRHQVGHETLSADEPAGRSRRHRLTLRSGPHGDLSKANTHQQPPLSKNEERKCEKPKNSGHYRFAFTPLASATLATLAPGPSVSLTILSFSSNPAKDSPLRARRHTRIHAPYRQPPSIPCPDGKTRRLRGTSTAVLFKRLVGHTDLWQGRRPDELQSGVAGWRSGINLTFGPHRRYRQLHPERHAPQGHPGCKSTALQQFQSLERASPRH